MRRFAHIVNPVVVAETSDLHVAQPVTFATMQLAQEFTLRWGHPEVSLYSACYPEDESMVPREFIRTPALERSTLDQGEFHLPLKLPFLGDVLDRLYAAATDADYLIYTNVDIGLLPNFYVTVDRLLDHGCDALTINPRETPEQYSDPADIPLMWAAGTRFRLGWDCFVFRREVFPQFDLDKVCLGALNIGRALLLNLVKTAENFVEHTEFHLTFHIGNAAVARRPLMSDYAAQNLRTVRRLLSDMKRTGKNWDHPVVQRMVEKMKANRQLEGDLDSRETAVP